MAKLKDLKEQHPALNITVIDMLKLIDPSDTNKYLPFLIKQLYAKAGGKTKIEEVLKHMIVEELGQANIKMFEKFHKYYENKSIQADILQIKDFFEMAKLVEYADETERLKEMESQVHKWFMDEEWLIVTPFTPQASALYGRGTKWCTTDAYTFNDYKSRGFLVYIINRKDDRKWAAYIQTESVAFYNAVDNRVLDSLFLPIPSVIKETLADLMNNFEGWSTDRLMKFHSAKHVKIKNKFYEIKKMTPKTAGETLKIFQPETELDKERVQNLTKRSQEKEVEAAPIPKVKKGVWIPVDEPKGLLFDSGKPDWAIELGRICGR
jgi:hypothetical protein